MAKRRRLTAKTADSEVATAAARSIDIASDQVPSVEDARPYGLTTCGACRGFRACDFCRPAPRRFAMEECDDIAHEPSAEELADKQAFLDSEMTDDC